MKKEINLILVSGFLGSGKTTFLKYILENQEGRKVGVLINEFGSIGIDGRLVERDGLRLVEINNGSIFCSCLKGGFVKALIDLSQTDIELLLIENSGMADPSNMHQILEELERKVHRSYHYKGAACIVDSTSFLKQVQVLAPVQNQVASSNLIIVNKIDKVNNPVLLNIENRIKQINETANIYKTMYSKIPLDVLAMQLKDNDYIGETSNQPWNRPATYALECDGSLTDKGLTDFAHRLEDKVLRMKGFARVDDSWRQVDVVDKDVSINKTQLGKRDILTKSKLVIIGRDTEDFKSQIQEAWRLIFGIEPEIYSDYDLCG
jgi:G3E family GTPase